MRAPTRCSRRTLTPRRRIDLRDRPGSRREELTRIAAPDGRTDRRMPRASRSSLQRHFISLVRSEAKDSAAVEDDDAESDEDDREQHVLPAFEDFIDPWPSGYELGEQD